MTPSRILLISNSTAYGGSYLGHVEDEIKNVLEGAKHVLFFPYALHDYDSYAAKAKTRFAEMGYSMESAHATDKPHEAIERCDTLFIGGGNTFRLLKALQDLSLIEPIRKKVSRGAPYIGSSAGSNVAGPTIKTTNDMPIVQPSSFDSLSLVPFQINPHYVDSGPRSKHMGETREERIAQFLEENETPVVGLREGAWLVIQNGTTVLKGSAGARIFRRSCAPTEILPGQDISELIA